MLNPPRLPSWASGEIYETMPHASQNPNPDDWRDRLVDRALAEHLGGETPPDLSARILAAAGEANSPAGELTMAAKSASQTSGLRGWLLAASVLVNVGLLAMLLAAQRDNRQWVVAQQAEETVTAEDELGFDVGSEQLNRNPNENFKWARSAAEGEETTGFAIGPAAPMGGEQAGDQAPTESFREKDSAESFSDNLDLVVSQTQEVEEMEFAEVQPPVEANGPARQGLDTKLATLSDLSMPATPAPTTRMRQDGEALSPRRPSSARFESWEELKRRREAVDSFGINAPAGGGRVTWGFQAGGEFGGRGGRGEWRLGEADGWHGSPDGRGIGPGASGDQYERIVENSFIETIGEGAISTFSIDVDTASYANVRQMLTNGQVPPADSVRLEELVNYFTYDYEGPGSITPSLSPSPQGGGEDDAASPQGGGEDNTASPQGGGEGDAASPTGGGEQQAPFAAHVEAAGCPWAPEHRLVRIGIKGREVADEKRPLSNLVFLVDISGSMQSPEKLPLVRHGLKRLAAKLGENDRVAIVVYASQEGLALPSTSGDDKEAILGVLDSLQAGGSTAGGAGITLAYQIAEDNFIEGGTNRVILCTDGDFNVGTTSTAELERLVEEKAKNTKVFLSAIGFGRGNLNDAMMEKVTGIGNGNYYYVDGEHEAERVFARGMTGMLVTIAKDVKIQVEFNPAKVAGYRLLGYENRMLQAQDFNDDKKDAGEIGAGHTVTCLYEIVPAGEQVDAPDIDELKYQRPASLTEAAGTDEMLTLKMRYKQPDEDTSSKLEWPIADSGQSFGEASRDLQFAASVASFGMLLRDSQYKGDTSYDAVLEIAQSTKGTDPEGERQEFVELVEAAKRLTP